MRAEALRVGLVGLGQAARNIHLPALRGLPELFQVAAGYDPAATLDGVSSVASFEALLAEKPDAVVIASPPRLHCEQTVRALEAGCHVFCEKPMAESLEEADRMLTAAERSGKRLVINSEFPEMRIHRAAREAIGGPDFGRLLFLRATQNFVATDETEAGWRRDARRRVCFDFGVHVFELARFFFGDDPARLDCRMPDPRGDGREALNLITLEWADGRAASIVLNRLAQANHRYLDMELTGERGQIVTSIGGEASVSAGLHGKRPYLDWTWAPGGTAVLHTAAGKRTLATESFQPFVEATQARLRTFADPEKSRGDAAQHRATLALTLAAYESAETGRGISLATSREASSGSA